MINRYPMWKYIMLLVIVVLSVVYAAPAFYGEDPAIQVSGTNKATITPAVINEVKDTLNNANLKYRSVREEGPNLLMVRFFDPNTQLKAKDYVKAALGNNYTVALNLASSTPEWLRALGAQPIKLGLDLRGGVHFLLYVDAKSTIAKRTQGDMRSIGKALRDKKIRYSGLRHRPNGSITINFRDESSLEQALPVLAQQFAELTFTKNDQAGVYQLNGVLSPAILVKEQQAIVDQTMMVLRNRINELGVSEPIVQQQGKDRISVDLPGIQDATQAKRIIGGTATLEFHLVDEKHDLSAALAGDMPAGSRIYKMSSGQPILLYNQVVLKGSAVTSATSSFGQDGRPVVNIRISGPQVSYFTRTTAENIGKRMAIVYVETKADSKLVAGKVVSTSRKVQKVISAPVIQSALPSSFQITGLDDAQEARSLSMQLRAGALPATISYLAESTVGPSLGKENIHKGILSIEIGFGLIVIFMALYYRLFGVFADLALLFNLVLLVAILSLLGATLTLPGIAGILLTLGMAVDANVLIFERVREELRNGMSIQASIHVGYEKAFATIVDAQVTTLIAAVALFSLGSGPVKGFAVTLTIGLLTSMFTAITGTRAIVNLLYGGRPHSKHLSIGIKLTKQ